MKTLFFALIFLTSSSVTLALELKRVDGILDSMTETAYRIRTPESLIWIQKDGLTVRQRTELERAVRFEKKVSLIVPNNLVSEIKVSKRDH